MTERQLTQKAGGQSAEKIKTWMFSTLLIALNIGVIVLFDRWVLTNEVLDRILSSKMEAPRIEEQAHIISQVVLINVVCTPLWVLLKIITVTSLLQLPLLLMNVEVAYKKIFRGVTISYYIFIIASIVKILWIKITPPENITNNTFLMNPLAVTTMLETSMYSAVSLSLLNTVNMFEALWIIFLIAHLTKYGGATLIDASIDTLLVWGALLFGQYGLLYYFTEVF